MDAVGARVQGALREAQQCPPLRPPPPTEALPGLENSGSVPELLGRDGGGSMSLETCGGCIESERHQSLLRNSQRNVRRWSAQRNGRAAVTRPALSWAHAGSRPRCSQACLAQWQGSRSPGSCVSGRGHRGPTTLCLRAEVQAACLFPDGAPGPGSPRTWAVPALVSGATLGLCQSPQKQLGTRRPCLCLPGGVLQPSLGCPLWRGFQVGEEEGAGRARVEQRQAEAALVSRLSLYVFLSLCPVRVLSGIFPRFFYVSKQCAKYCPVYAPLSAAVDKAFVLEKPTPFIYVRCCRGPLCNNDSPNITEYREAGRARPVRGGSAGLALFLALGSVSLGPGLC